MVQSDRHRYLLLDLALGETLGSPQLILEKTSCFISQQEQLETKTEDICMIRWSKPSGVYIMNFYRPKYVTYKKMESGRHTRSPRDRGCALRGGPSSLVGACPFRTTCFFLKFLNIPKLIKIAIGVVLESVYLPYHIPIPFRSLERSGKCPLCIPQGLRFQ